MFHRDGQPPRAPLWRRQQRFDAPRRQSRTSVPEPRAQMVVSFVHQSSKRILRNSASALARAGCRARSLSGTAIRRAPRHGGHTTLVGETLAVGVMLHCMPRAGPGRQAPSRQPRSDPLAWPELSESLRRGRYEPSRAEPRRAEPSRGGRCGKASKALLHRGPGWVQACPQAAARRVCRGARAGTD